MSDPKHPKVGDLAVDISEVDSIDLPNDTLAGLIRAHQGFEEAVEAVLALSPKDRASLGITDEEFSRLSAWFKNRGKALSLLPAALKIAEILDETARFEAHRISERLGVVAQHARRSARSNPVAKDSLARLQALVDYWYGPGRKAVRTRSKAKADSTAK